MKRRRELKKTDYQVKFSTKINDISKYSGIELTKSFIIVCEDRPELYPKPDSIVALISDEDYLIKPTIRISEEDIYYSDSTESIKPKKHFLNFKADSFVGTKQTRYLFVVDQLTEDGDVVVYDDDGNHHVFKEEYVMVVEPYVYSAASYEGTFKGGIDYSNELLAVKMTDFYTENELCVLVNECSFLMYERVMVNLPTPVKESISNIYLDRGLLYDNRFKVVRVVLENTVLEGTTFESGIKENAIECLNSLRDFGFHIDIMSNEYRIGKDAQIEISDKLINSGVEYDTWNSNYKYDFIIDSRCGMSHNTVLWDLIHLNITGIHLPNKDGGFETLENIIATSDEISSITSTTRDALDEYMSDVNVPEFVEEVDLAKGLVGEDDENMMYVFKGTYEDLLHINETSYNIMVSEGRFDELYPLLLGGWGTIKELQRLYFNKITVDKISHDSMKVIREFGIDHLFNKSKIVDSGDPLINTVLETIEMFGFEPIYSEHDSTISFSALGGEHFTETEKEIVQEILGERLNEFYYAGDNTQIIYIKNK